MLEESVARGIALRRGRVFADLWDLERLRDCADCFDARVLPFREVGLLAGRLRRLMTDKIYAS